MKQNPEKPGVLGEGTQRRPFFHVRDYVYGLSASLEHRSGLTDIVNIAKDDTASVGCPKCEVKMQERFPKDGQSAKSSKCH
jgi:hypothetical protein